MYSSQQLELSDRSPGRSAASSTVGDVPSSTNNDTSGAAETRGFEAAATKRLMRKIDGIGNARLAKLEASLGLDVSPSSLQYNVALSVFFPWYIIAEIPSNLAMKRFRPSIWIPSIMVAWSIVCIAMGFVHNYAGLLACRMALGLAEGGLFPGINYYISLWYRRHECALRMAMFFSAATAAGAFGGLLARGIVEMDGLGGLGGWAWIFIIEGLVTLLIALAAYYFMNDYPETAGFLTPEERAEIARRLENDRSGLADEYGIQYLWDAIKDWKIWVHSLITIGIYAPLGSFALFLPTIVRALGFTDDKGSQLMTIPPYVAACICCIGGGWLADRYKQRGIYMIMFNLIAIMGFVMLISSTHSSVKYAGTFFAAMGVYPNVPLGVAWNSNNIGGSTKRGVGIAMQIGIGNLGGVISGFLYRSKDAPMYYPGHGTLIATLTMSTILSIFMTIYLRCENARRDRDYKPPADYTVLEKVLERERGDDASYFRYTV